MGSLAELFFAMTLVSGQWVGPIAGSSAADLVAALKRPDPAATRSLSVSVGNRVRFSTTAGQSVTEGEVLASDPEALLLKVRGVEEPVRIPWSSLRRLEVHRGQRSLARRGETIGMLTVGIPLALLTVLSAGGADLGDGELAAVALGVGTVGAAVGGLAGALTGRQYRTDRWDKVNLHRIQIGVTPQRAGGLAVALSVRF